MPGWGVITFAYFLCVESVIIGGGSSLARRAVSDGIFAYQLANVGKSAIQFIPSTSAVGRSELLSGNLSFCVTEGTFSLQEFNQTKDLLLIPLMAGAVVPIYNLPPLGDTALVLSKALLSQIFLGNIQYWDHPNITALNPNMTGIHEKIQLVVREEPSGTTFVFTSTLSEFDPEFKNRIGASEFPMWKNFSNHECSALTTEDQCKNNAACVWEAGNSGCIPEFPRILKEQKNLGVAGKVATTSFSIGYAIQADAVAQGVNYVSLQIMSGHEPVVATVQSLTFSILEHGAKEMRNDGQVVQINNPINPLAWPIVGYSYLAVVLHNATDMATCDDRAQTVRFWTWFLSSGVMRDLAAQNGFVTTPDIIRRTNLLAEKLSNMTCDAKGTLAVPAARTTDYSGSGLSSGSILSTFRLYLRLFSSEDVENTIWVYDAKESVASIRELMAFDTGFSTAIVSLLPKQLRRDVAAAGIRFMPLFFYASLPVFKLPGANVSSITLTFDWETLGKVFTGNITRWNDTAFSALNPALPDQVINVVVASDAESASVFAQSLYQNSVTFRTAVNAGLALAGLTEVSYPFNWSWGFANHIKPANFTIVEERNRQSQLLIISNEGYISFRVFGSDVITDAANILHQGSKMSFSKESMLACYSKGVSLVGDEAYANTNDAWAVEGGAGCWPFTQLASVAVYSSFNSQNSVMRNRDDSPVKCDSQHSLELLSWMYKTESLKEATSLGLGWLSAGDRAVFASQLERFTCDGVTILRLFPMVWELQTGVFVFIIIASILGILLTLASAVAMFRYRSKLTFKKSGPEFMSIVLVGTGLMYLSVIFYAVKPTLATCGLFYWFANLGFTCVFGPLFLKNLRIYRIFLSSQFAIKTLSNRRMFAYFALLLCFHIIIIALNQGLEPLAPVTSLSTFPDFEEFTQCNTNAATAWTFNVDMMYLAVMLICNAALCFGVRHVDRSFNESKKIGFVVYNTILCYAMALLLLLAINMRGTRSVLLFALVIYWTTTFIVTIHFLVKTRKVFLHKGNQGRDLETLRANLALTRAAPSQTVRKSEAITSTDPAAISETRGRINTDPEPARDP